MISIKQNLQHNFFFKKNSTQTLVAMILTITLLITSIDSNPI
jgi:hypothetical protein